MQKLIHIESKKKHQSEAKCDKASNKAPLENAARLYLY
jgi:hypothetical protein